MQFLYVRALLLLGALHLRMQHTGEVRHCMEQVIDTNKKGDFAYDVKMEVERYPELRRYLDQAEQAVIQPALLADGSMVAWQEDTVVPSTLEILAFGDPQLVIDGEPVTRWHLTRSLELFFLLLERGRPVQKEQMIEILWPNAVSDQIDTTVRTAIYYLRKVIGKSCIVYRSGLYSLDMAAGYGTQVWYDVSLFEEHYQRARKALEEQDDEVAREAFTGMVGLYRGPFLQSFYNDWCIPRRDYLQRAYMDARQQLAVLAERREEWEESLKHWQQLLLLDSCSEEAHYGVMNCYMRMGRRKLALQQYQLCCRYLQEELSITPGPVIQRLYQDLLRTRGVR
jgi:DNA-binding SARP family transcriptional activator